MKEIWTDVVDMKTFTKLATSEELEHIKIKPLSQKSMELEIGNNGI